jgi:hypothetical protein
MCGGLLWTHTTERSPAFSSYDHHVRTDGPISDDPNWLRVETHEDADALDDPETFGDFIVTFSDRAAHDHDQLVEESVAVVAAFPGVVRAVREDRELIVMWGRNVDGPALQVTLHEWWTARLGAS